MSGDRLVNRMLITEICTARLLSDKTDLSIYNSENQAAKTSANQSALLGTA